MMDALSLQAEASVRETSVGLLGYVERYRDQMTITTAERPLDNDICTASC